MSRREPVPIAGAYCLCRNANRWFRHALDDFLHARLKALNLIAQTVA